MSQRKLQHVLKGFRQTVRECRDFAADAHQWSLPGAHPHISRKRRDSIAELAFLRAFLGWESFLEDSFVLYLMGQKAPRGRTPHRFAIPPDRKSAEEWVIPEGRPYASWDAQHVGNRAERFFRGGYPFTTVLRTSQNLFAESKMIRNAIAHESRTAHDKFESLVRAKLRTLPAKLTVGSFLGTRIPGTTPPVSFLEHYLDKIEFVAKQIVPGA